MDIEPCPIAVSCMDDENSVTVIDTITETMEKKRAKYRSTANYSIAYIGEKEETIYLYPNNLYYEMSVYDYTRYRSPKSNEIRLQVDQHRVTGPPRRNHKSLTEKATKGTFSHPVVIENLSQDTLNIGLGQMLNIYAEAIDGNGEWHPIEAPFNYFCGTGLKATFLPPGHVMLTTYGVYKGSHRTMVRLVYQLGGVTLYSNEFNSFIELSQFEKDPNHRGFPY